MLRPLCVAAAVGTSVGLAGIATAGGSASQDGSSALTHYVFDSDSARQWRLPRRLQEISGLAATATDRLYAHDDERAVIYEVEGREGALLKAWAMGDEVVAGDFEGLARVDRRWFLVTSSGRLFESGEGADGERLIYNTYGTGVGRSCEVEGLAFDPTDRSLLLICKTIRAEAWKDHVLIFRWSVDNRRLSSDSVLAIPLQRFTEPLGERRFSPSGIERHPTHGTYFIVAAREEAIAEITPDGRVLGVRPLPKDLHRQVEGITFLSDRTLVLADEGGNGRARLTLYPVAPNRMTRD